MSEQITETLMLALMLGLFSAALYVFVLIQHYLNDPQRKQRNEEWFRRFQEHLAASYRDPQLAWRVSVLERSFYRPCRGAPEPPA